MRITLIILAFLYLFFGVSPVFAGFTFNVPKTTITSDEEIEATVTLSLQGQNDKTYYLEGAFKKEGTTNYFGLTWNDSSWVPYTSSNFTTLKPITTDQVGGWNGSINVKIDAGSSLFSGGGTYILRVKRFTTGGSATWADNDVTLIVSSLASPTPSSTPIPTPTPSPSPSPTPKPSPSPTSSSSSSISKTKTTSATSTPTASPKSSSTPFPSAQNTSLPTKSLAKSNIASVAATTASATPSAEVVVKNQKQNKPLVLIGIIFIIAGIGSLGHLIFKKYYGSIYHTFRKRHKDIGF